MAAIPEGVERVRVAGPIVSHNGLRDDGVGAAGAGEAGGFGETAELDRHVARAFDFVDGVGDRGIADVRFVGAVEEDDGLVGLRVGDPLGELGSGGDGAGGVVGKTEIDEIGGDAGDGGNITVGRSAIEVGDALVAAVDVGSGAAGHDVGVDVDGVDGIGDGELHILRKNFLNIPTVALRAVGDENFVGVDLASAGGVVVGGDGLAEEGVALLRAVALEGGALGHFVRRGVHRLDAHGRERFGDVTDAEADDGLRRIGGNVGAHALGDIAEEIGGLELGVVFVDANHGRSGKRSVRI